VSERAGVVSPASPGEPPFGDASAFDIPIVDYLVLDEAPHLVAHECTTCGARYFDHRVACAACTSVGEFTDVALPPEGVVDTFTIVMQDGPGVDVPFVAAVVECGSTHVRTNLINVEADPEHVRPGMRVHLVTWHAATDPAGRRVVGFGFEPAEGARR
jgi:uncharacterized OB-fold protein